MAATVDAPRRVMALGHAVVVRGTGGAIVTLDRTPEVPTVVAIERFPLAIGPLAERLRVIRADDRGCRIVVDADGLGDALWDLLGSPDHRRGWRLYAKRGQERQELTRELLVAVARRTFTFTPGLAEAEAMRKALLEVTRDVREDGPGSELAVALSLALGDRPRPVPRIY
jgi:hypothetical protein